MFLKKLVAVTVAGESNTVIPPGGFEPRETGLLPRLDSPKEGLECLVQPLENVLSAMIVRKCQTSCVADFLQLIRLRVIVQRYPMASVCVPTFLKRGIIQSARLRQLHPQGLFLSLRGIQPIFEGLSHNRPCFAFTSPGDFGFVGAGLSSVRFFAGLPAA